MKIICATAAVLALAVTPALADKPVPSPTHAYGKFCQNQSKKHVAGQTGTPFSKCIVGVAQMRKTQAPSSTT